MRNMIDTPRLRIWFFDFILRPLSFLDWYWEFRSRGYPHREACEKAWWCIR